MKKYYLLITASVILFSCHPKRTLNKAGDVAGQTVGTVVNGFYHGAVKAFDVTVEPASSLADKGISLGKSTYSTDTSSANNNLLTVYIIFNADFNGTITSKAFDHNNLEMGRATQAVIGKKNEARYVEFHFDKRTAIDSGSKLTLE